MPSYVFVEKDDGLQLIGDWDGLYSNDADPWTQSGKVHPMGSYYTLSRRHLAKCVNRWVPQGIGIEVGCGHGHVTNYLTYITNLEWHGFDISKVAIEQARTKYPNLSFHVCDITEPMDMEFNWKADVVVLDQLLWYILEKMDAAVENCLRLLTDDGVLILSQAFLKGEQRYGKEIAEGFAGTFNLFLNRYRDKLEFVQCNYDTSSMVHNDGLMAFRKTIDATQRSHQT